MNIKKLLCLTLIVSLSAGLCWIPSVGANVSSSKAIGILTELGIMEKIVDDRVQLVDTLKRRDFAVIMANIISGGEKISVEGTAAFSDVPLYDEAASSIALVYGSGIMGGYGDGTFSPDMSITYSEAIKGIVCLLGYQAQAENFGGYPLGYLRSAAQLGLLSGIDTSLMDEFIDLENLSRMLYNTFNIPYLKQTVFGDSRQSYYSGRDVTLLSERFDVYRERGIVNDNAITALDGVSGISKGKVKIGEEVLDAGNIFADNLLGYYVTYYYSQEMYDDTKTLVYIEIDSSKNETLELDVNDIDGLIIAAGSRKIELSYTAEGGNQRRAYVSNIADVIRNGKAWRAFTEATLLPQSGTVTLIANDGGGEYNVMIIESYEVVLADQVSPYFGTVTDKYKKTADGSTYVVDLIDENSTRDKVTILQNGSPIPISEIRAWDVLSIYTSEDANNRIVEVIVTRNTVSGMVTEIGDRYVVVDGRRYTLGASFRSYLASQGKVLEMGEALFYLDHKGEIAAMNETDSSEIYGYIRAAIYKELSNELSLRVWNIENDIWNTYNTTKKVQVDGASVPLKSITQMTHRLILYKVNGSGEIYEINTPEELIVPSVRSEDFGAPVSEFWWTGNVNGLVDARYEYGTHYYLTNQTKQITISSDPVEMEDETLYRAGISWGEKTGYNLKLYKGENPFTPGAVVYEVQKSGDPSHRAFELNPGIILTKISQAMNADGVITRKITGISDSGEVSYIFSNELMKKIEDQAYFRPLNDLALGDLIRVSTNVKGEVDDVRYEFSAKNQRSMISNDGSFYIGYVIYYGRVGSVDLQAGILEIVTDTNSGPMSLPVMIGSSVVMLYEGENKPPRQVSSGELKPGQNVVFRGREGWGRIIEIFETDK